MVGGWRTRGGSRWSRCRRRRFIRWAVTGQGPDRDETARSERIERGQRALQELSERLAGLRARITTRGAVEEAAASILAGLGAERYRHLTVTETETVKSATAKRSADALARTPATASSPRPASSSTSRSTPTPVRYDLLRRLLPSHHQRPRVSLTPRSSPSTATSPTSSSATTSSNQSKTPRPSRSRAPSGSRRCSPASLSRCSSTA